MSVYLVDGKKMMNICILEILKKYTDAEHTMDQKDIVKKLETMVQTLYARAKETRKKNARRLKGRKKLTA